MRRPLLTPPQRATLLSLCTAVYGLAIGIASYPLWIRPSKPDQIPGFTKSIGIDANTSLRVFAAVVFITIAVAVLMRPIVRILTAPDARAWARNGAAIAMIVALWYAALSRTVVWTAIPAAIAIAIFTLLRRVPMHFTRRDAILLASFAPVFMGLADFTSLSVERALVIAAGSVLALRLALVFIGRGRGLDATLCFAFSPIALMLQSHFLARDERHAGWPALLVVFVTPILLRLFISNTAVARRRLRIAIAFVVYPLAAYGYVSASGLLSAEGKPRASFFEEMQHITPAQQMMRGAKPYVDVIPPHGLIQDALVDYFILKTGPQTLGNVLRVRLTINGFLAIATYALGAAATGSPDIGFLGFCASAVLGQAAGVVRFAPSLIGLVIAAAALRRRKPCWLAGSGAAAIIAGLTSIDFGFYGIVTTIFAAFRFEGRGAKMRALIWGVMGGVITGVIASLYMMANSYFPAFLRVSIFEVARVGAAYTLTPFNPTPAIDKMFPDLLAAVLDPASLAYMVWFASLIAVAVVLANGIRANGRRRGAFDALVVIVFYVVLLGLSYAERHHIYFQAIVGPLFAIVAFRASRARATLPRLAAPALVAILLIASNVTVHFAIVGWLRRSRGPIEPGWREISLPRGRGALFREPDIATLDRIAGYMTTHLGPDDTFFDFTNRGLMYFLLDKPMPVRQIEVAYYETEELQREVIDRLERNPRVRAAIVPAPQNDQSGVDLIANEVRAPLVWKYLQDHFQPDFEEGPVAIWRRK